jgi:multidrug resistance efflux pump
VSRLDLTSDMLRELDDEYATLKPKELKAKLASVDREIESINFDLNRAERRRRIIVVALEEATVRKGDRA